MSSAGLARIRSECTCGLMTRDLCRTDHDIGYVMLSTSVLALLTFAA